MLNEVQNKVKSLHFGKCYTIAQRSYTILTFGYTPLQQYLVPFEGGRFQYLPIAWDTDRQKWFHLGDTVYPGHALGLRIMVDKHSRANLAADIGFGEKSFGFYMAASEVF